MSLVQKFEQKKTFHALHCPQNVICSATSLEDDFSSCFIAAINITARMSVEWMMVV